MDFNDSLFQQQYYENEVSVQLPFNEYTICKNTKKNIEKCINELNGKTIERMEIFSFLDSLSEITSPNWKLGEYKLQKRYHKEIGYGISYVASAIYQLALRTNNVLVSQRYNHDFIQWYADIGLDCIIDPIHRYDLKIENKSDSDIILELNLRKKGRKKYLEVTFISEEPETISKGNTRILKTIYSPNTIVNTGGNKKKPHTIIEGKCGGSHKVYQNNVLVSEGTYFPIDHIIHVPQNTEIILNFGDKATLEVHDY